MSNKALLIQKRFGQKVKQLRLDKELSQLELAIECELEKTAISRIENGRTNVTLKTAFILSEALGVDMKDLFEK